MECKNNDVTLPPLSRRLLPTLWLVALTLAVSTTPSVHAGFFDNLKKRAEDAVKDNLPNLDSEKRKAEKKAEDKIMAPLEKKPQKKAQAKPSKPKSSAAINSVPYLMERWPHGSVKNKPVKEVELRGVHLGQPLPDAHKALLEAGFSYVRQNGLSHVYGMTMLEEGGKRFWVSKEEYATRKKSPDMKIIRSLHMSIEVTTPSEIVMAELPKFPANALQAPTPNTAIADRASRRSRADRIKRASASATKGPRKSKAPQYVSGFEYNQKFISGETVDWKQIMNKARQRFGEPNYTVPSTQRRGKAYKTGTHSLWYLDAASLPKNQIEKILAGVKQQKDQGWIRQMVWRDLMHPGVFEKVAYNMQYSDNFDETAGALRVAGSPYLYGDCTPRKFAAYSRGLAVFGERAVVSKTLQRRPEAQSATQGRREVLNDHQRASISASVFAYSGFSDPARSTARWACRSASSSLPCSRSR